MTLFEQYQKDSISEFQYELNHNNVKCIDELHTIFIVDFTPPTKERTAFCAPEDSEMGSPAEVQFMVFDSDNETVDLTGDDYDYVEELCYEKLGLL